MGIYRIAGLLSLKSEFAPPSRQEAEPHFLQSSHAKPFLGVQALKYPQMGSFYRCHVDEFGERSTSSATRPLILIGHYTHKGKIVACDFISTESAGQHNSRNAKQDRYSFIYSEHGVAGCSQTHRLICGTNIITLPNNPDAILSGPIGKQRLDILPDYFLRRALVAYEEKPRWFKGAVIPEGSIRHGILLNGFNKYDCLYKDSRAPDMPHSEYPFRQVHEGPEFLLRSLPAILEWASAAHLISSREKLDVKKMPNVGTFPHWSAPEADRPVRRHFADTSSRHQASPATARTTSYTGNEAFSPGIHI